MTHPSLASRQPYMRGMSAASPQARADISPLQGDRPLDTPRPMPRDLQPVIVMGLSARADSFRLKREMGPLLGRLRNAIVQGGSVVVHLTAAERGDGVSTISREIAFAAALTPFCRVLVLDSSAVEEPKAGTLGQQLPDIVGGWLRTGEAEVASVTVGSVTFHAAALTPSFEPSRVSDAGRSIAELYEGLRRSYDLIIVDCPPVLEAPYFVRIAQETPEVVLVVTAEKTRIPEVIRAKDEVAVAGANLAGIVFNRRRFHIPGFLRRRL